MYMFRIGILAVGYHKQGRNILLCVCVCVLKNQHKATLQLNP